MKTLTPLLLLICLLFCAASPPAQLPAPVYPPIATNPVATLTYPGCGWAPWCNAVSPPLQCVVQPTWIYGDGAIPNQWVKWNGWVSFGMSDGNTTPSNYTGFFVVWYGLNNDPWITTALPLPFSPTSNLLLVPPGVGYVTLPCTHTQQNAFSHQNLAGFQLPPPPLTPGIAIYGQSLSIDNLGVFRMGAAVRSPIVP